VKLWRVGARGTNKNGPNARGPLDPDSVTSDTFHAVTPPCMNCDAPTILLGKYEN
jgi:hypothetical protein